MFGGRLVVAWCCLIWWFDIGVWWVGSYTGCFSMVYGWFLLFVSLVDYWCLGVAGLLGFG